MQSSCRGRESRLVYFNPFKPSILLWDIGEQWKPTPDAAVRGIWSGFALFACKTCLYFSLKHNWNTFLNYCFIMVLFITFGEGWKKPSVQHFPEILPFGMSIFAYGEGEKNAANGFGCIAFGVIAFRATSYHAHGAFLPLVLTLYKWQSKSLYVCKWILPFDLVVIILAIQLGFHCFSKNLFSNL